MPAKLDIDWKIRAVEREAVELTLVRQITRPRPELRCPECNAVLYSRRSKVCSICGDELPQELLFSAMEAAKVEQLLRAERAKHRAWLNRRLS